MSWTLFPDKDETERASESDRFVIEYVPCTSEFFRGPSGRYDQQPTETTTVTGASARRTTAQAIREAGGRVVKVRRRGWLW